MPKPEPTLVPGVIKNFLSKNVAAEKMSEVGLTPIQINQEWP